MKSRDEHYVIDLCDEVLHLKALRQHRFDFLCGDPGKNGVCRRLPVDAYYPQLNLVIEYREKQHTEPVKFFDKPHRLTCSGCTRDEQRRRYDQRRSEVLKQHGITLVEVEYSQFCCDGRGRLRRNEVPDEAVLRQALSKLTDKL